MAGRRIFSLFGSIAIEGMAGVKKDLTAFDKELRLVNKNLNKLGRDLTKTGKVLTKNLTLPLGAAAIAAIKFGADFDQAMTSSIAIMGDVSDSMRKDLEQTARDVAKTTKFSATEAAEAYFFLASAGLDAAESMRALPKVAKFAQAGNFNLAEATDLLTDAQSALGLSSENIEERMANMTKLSDVLVKANTVANGSVKQFSEALTNKAGAALRLLNKDMEEGVAVLAVFADQGVKGTDAGTKLGIVLRDLQKAAVNNKKGFADAGISVFDATGDMRNMADIVSDLENRLGGMSDEQKRTELSTLGFTDKSLSATQALLGTSEAIREYEMDLRNAGGITEEVAAKQLKTFWAQLGLLKSRAIDLGITLGKVLIPILMDHLFPALEKLVGVMENVMKWFGEHKVIAQFVGVFLTIMAAMGPILLLFVKFLPLIKGMIALYKILTVSQLTLNAVMTANPVGAIVVGVAALIAAIIVLVKNWDYFREKFIDVWDAVKFHFLNISGNILLAYNKMILSILEGINRVGKFVPGLNKGLGVLIKSYKSMNAALERGLESGKASNEVRKATIELGKKEKKAVEEAAKAAEEKAVADKEAAEEKKKLTLEEIEAARALAKERNKFEADWTEKHAAQSRTRVEAVEAERMQALANAKALNADTAKINAYYDAEAKKVREEIALEVLREQKAAADKKLKIEKKAAADAIALAKKEKREKINAVRQVMSMISQVSNGINDIWKASLNKRTAEIDAETSQRKTALDASVMSEEDRAEAIATIDSEAEAKKIELQRENAKREKGAALFGIGLSTATAIAAALTIPPPLGIIMAGIVGAMGLVQLGIAAATPIPFAEGGMVKSTPGRGIIAQIGEGTQDEVVLPMKTGAAELADNIMARVGSAGANMAGVTRGVAKEVHNHFHIGTLIADDFGVKTLAKRIRPYTIAENQRVGA